MVKKPEPLPTWVLFVMVFTSLIGLYMVGKDLLSRLL